MLHSLNEIVSTLRKAGRGAGLDDGAAEDIARAAGLAVAANEDGFAWALDALRDVGAAGALVAAADLIEAGETVEAPGSPLLPWLLSDEDPGFGAFEIAADAWAAALALAHETYVPASDASRLAGAGAGTSDND